MAQNWRAKPLVSCQVIVDLISATSSTDLEVRCELDANTCPKGVIVSDAEIAAVNVEHAESRRMELHDPPHQPLRSSD
jgi:hypothetical protein